MTDKTPRGRWIRLAADYQMDPRIIRAGARAELVYIRTLALSRQLGTDGHISAEHETHLTRGLVKGRLLLPTLLEVELLHRCEDGWQVPPERWERWQTTQADWDAKRDADRIRKAAWRATKRASEQER